MKKFTDAVGTFIAYFAILIGLEVVAVAIFDRTFLIAFLVQTSTVDVPLFISAIVIYAVAAFILKANIQNRKGEDSIKKIFFLVAVFTLVYLASTILYKDCCYTWIAPFFK